jgi:acetyl coenzyme A synthetase (ADP forming)-like protein
MVRTMNDAECSDSSLDRLFSPRGIAVVGASKDPLKIGYKVLSNIVKGGFKGGIYPVNLNGGMIMDLPVFTTLGSIPGPVDTAVICVPAKFVNAVLEEMGRKGIPFAVVISAGFREIGAMELEQELLDTARKNNIRILGPNIFGLIYTPASMNSQFGAENVLPGNVSIITQSGALGLALMGKTAMEGIGISAMVSVGNKLDIRDEELLEFLCGDPHTKIILMYIEGLSRGKEFMETVRRISLRKPVIVLKSGRTKAGAKAASSHTASLAGEDRIFSGAFAQSGALRAPTLRDALDWTKVLLHLPLPKNDNVLIITNGGGFGVLATDACSELGLKLYDNMDWLYQNLMPILPNIATIGNPLDITAQTSPEAFIKCLQIALKEESIGALIGIFGTTTGTDRKKFTQDAIKAIGRPEKPLVLCTIGGAEAMDQVDDYNRASLPAFFYPEEAVYSFEVLYKYQRMKQNLETSTTQEFDWDLAMIRSIFKDAPRDNSGFIDMVSALKVLEKGPIRIAPYKPIKSFAEALKFVNRYRYPVVMKVSALNMLHKTEKGAVIVDINSSEELESAYSRLTELGGDLVIMSQVKGRETIVGATRDRIFGPAVMFGIGGIMVEALNDVSFRIAPVTWADTEEMIREVKGSVILGDFRGKKAVDLKSLKSAIMALGDLMVKMPEIKEIEVNPLFAAPEGAISADCRIRLE